MEGFARSRSMRSRIGVVLLAMGLFLGYGAAGPGEAFAEEGSGLRCTDLAVDAGGVLLKGHPTGGRYVVADDVATVEVFIFDTNESQAANWLSDSPVFAVIAHSGQGARVYEHDPAALAAEGVLPPEMNHGTALGFKSIEFCYRTPAPAPLGLSVLITDSPDPVEPGDLVTFAVAIDADPRIEAGVAVIQSSPILPVTDVSGCPGALTIDGTRAECEFAPPSIGTGVLTATATALEGGVAVTTATIEVSSPDEIVVADDAFTTIDAGPGGSGGGHDGGHDDDGHDDDGGHDDGGRDGGRGRQPASCDAMDASWKSVIVSGNFPAGSRVARDHGATIWVHSSTPDGVRTINWTSDVPVDAVIALGGPDAVVTHYGPAMAGGGITAPTTGSGAPRPLKAVHFCLAERPEVALDLEVDAPGEPVETETLVRLVAHVTNLGYQRAEGVTLSAHGPAAFVLDDPVGCETQTSPDGWRMSCPLEAIDGWDSTRVGIIGTATGDGPIDVAFEATAINLSDAIDPVAAYAQVEVTPLTTMPTAPPPSDPGEVGDTTATSVVVVEQVTATTIEVLSDHVVLPATGLHSGPTVGVALVLVLTGAALILVPSTVESSGRRRR